MDNKTRDILQKFSTQKVELASFENEKNKFKQFAKKVFKDQDDVTAKYRDAIDEIRQSKKDVEQAFKMLETLQKKANKAQAEFKSLGIEAPSYLFEIDGVGFLGWENNLIDTRQILNTYINN